MPSETSDEPRYDATGADQTIAPQTSNGHRDPSGQNGDYRDLLNDDTDINIAAQIDPPEGFQPDSPGAPSTSRQRALNTSAARSSSSSTSSQLSSSSSSNRNETSNCLSKRVAAARDRESDINNDTTHTGDQTTSGDNRSNRQNGSTFSHNRGALSISQQKELQPIPSTSSKLIDGFSNIVTKISRAFANTSLSMLSTDS